MGGGRIKDRDIEQWHCRYLFTGNQPYKTVPCKQTETQNGYFGHLQQFMDLLSFGGTVEDFVSKGYSIDYIWSYSAVLQQSFRFAVFPKQYITFNPMQYVVMRHKKDNMEISFVCLREDGCLELPATVETACRTAAKKVPELEGFHFHTLRHTYTTNLLSNGAQPKDVQELLGHSDVSTTMNVYAHATREAKRESAKLLDKVVGMN